MGDAAYDATLSSNHKVTIPSGASAQDEPTSGGSILIITPGGDLDTLAAWTMEWVFKFRTQATDLSYLWSKSSALVNTFVVEYDRRLDTLLILRGRNAGTADTFVSDGQVGFTDGSWYDVQITWGAVGTTPVLKINNVNKPLTRESTGTGAAYTDDHAYGGRICQATTGSRCFLCTLTLFRLHNAVLSSGDLTGNYYVDLRRYHADAAWKQGGNQWNSFEYVENDPVIPGEINFPLVWWDSSTEYYHAYGGDADYQNILHATSTDGLDWELGSPSNIPLTVGTGWENGTVAVSLVWKEGSTWYMLYRGTSSTGVSKTGLATHDLPYLPFTKYASNPVLAEPDPAGIIKVGSTYYLYVNGTGGDRSISVYTSDDLIDWTAYANNPILTEPTGYTGRFCACPFVQDGTYYLITSRYGALPPAFARSNYASSGELELWASASPYMSSPTLVGVMLQNDTRKIDTPSIPTTDVTRSEFPNGKLWVYFAKVSYPIGGGMPWRGYLTVPEDISPTIASPGSEAEAIAPTATILTSYGYTQTIVPGTSTTVPAVGVTQGSSPTYTQTTVPTTSTRLYTVVRTLISNPTYTQPPYLMDAVTTVPAVVAAVTRDCTYNQSTVSTTATALPVVTVTGTHEYIVIHIPRHHNLAGKLRWDQ